MSNAFVPAADASPADWVLANLHAFGAYDVGSIIPACFASYARVFHPAALLKPVRDTEQGRLSAGPRITSYEVKDVSWAKVAAANGRQMHPAAEWGSITGSLRYLSDGEQPGIWNQPPAQGNLLGPARPLAAVLRKFTSTPEQCWFGVWEGHGVPLYENLQSAPRFGTDSRRWLLLHGPVESTIQTPFPRWHQSPNLWWPEDRAWCVGTEIDLLTTYVGGSGECIEAVLSDALLEALPVPVDQRVTWDSDTINPLPPRDSQYGRD